MKQTTAKKASRWVTLIHRVITILLAVITGTGLVKNDSVEKAIEFTKEATMMGINAENEF